MAYTDDQVYGAFKTGMNGSFIKDNDTLKGYTTNLDKLWQQSKDMGVSKDQFDAAAQKYATTDALKFQSEAQDKVNAAAVAGAGGATTATPWNGGAGPNAEEIKNARSWSTGKSGAEIAAKAKELGVTADQMGSVFGYSGEEAAHTGYGSAGGLMDAYKTPVWDGTKFVQPSSSTTSTTTETKTGDTTITPVAPVAPVVPAEAPAAQPAQTYQAAQTTVDPTKTTAGLMQELLAEDSPWRQQAMALSMDKFNARGLGSSSFAQGAGVAAAIDAALGIAGPDAQIYNKTALSNTDAKNQAGQFNAGESNKMNLQTQAQGYDAAKTDKLQGFNLQNMSLQQKNDLEKITTTMTAQQSNDLAKMALNQGYDLAKMSTAQLNDLAKMSTAQGYVKEMAGINQAFDITKMDKAAALTLSQMDKQQINAIATMTAAHGFDMQKLSQNQIYAMEQLRQSGQNSIASAGVGASATLQAAALHADANKALNLSNQQFATLTNKSNQAASIMTNLQNTLTGIDQNPNYTDAAAKTTMKENVVTTTRAALSVIQSASTDTDLLDIMDQVFG